MLSKIILESYISKKAVSAMYARIVHKTERWKYNA